MSIPSVTSASWSGGGGTTQTNQRPAANLNASLDICMAKYEEYTTPIDGMSAQYTSNYTFLDFTALFVSVCCEWLNNLYSIASTRLRIMRELERLDRSLWTSVMEEMIGQQVVVICKANENLTEKEYEVTMVRQQTARILF